MSAEITDRDGDTARVAVCPDGVSLTTVVEELGELRRVTMEFEPEKARELADALRRAADEVEGKPHIPDMVRQFLEENPGFTATGRLDSWRPPMQ